MQYCLAERQREGSVVSPPEEVGGCVHARHEVTRVRYSRFTSAEGNGEFCRVEPLFDEVVTILRFVQTQCRSTRNHRKERTSVLSVSKNKGTQERACKL